MTSTALAKKEDPKTFVLLSEAQVRALSPVEKMGYQFNRFKDLVLKRRDELAASMPKHVDADRILRIALTEIRKTPKLLDCDIGNLLGAVAQSASLGLEIGGPLGQAYLVPYKERCELIIGYKGLLSMARRSGTIKSIEARSVFKDDAFEYAYGMQPTLVHTPSGDTDPANLQAAYAIAHFKDGGFQMEVMLRNQIERIKTVAMAKSSGKGPWNDYEEEMWKKTVLRRLMKMLPLQAEIYDRMEVEEKIERGAVVHDDLGTYDALTGEVVPEEQPKQ
jgi:recombination protein RecT